MRAREAHSDRSRHYRSRHSRRSGGESWSTEPPAEIHRQRTQHLPVLRRAAGFFDVEIQACDPLEAFSRQSQKVSRRRKLQRHRRRRLRYLCRHCGQKLASGDPLLFARHLTLSSCARDWPALQAFLRSPGIYIPGTCVCLFVRSLARCFGERFA